MDTENLVVDSRPNLQPEKVPVENVSNGLEAIAAKMTAMREQTLRNQMAVTKVTETGSESAAAQSAPVAPEGIAVDSDSDTNSVEPEVVDPEAEYAEGQEEAEAPEEVSQADTTREEIIDFLEFAESNPGAKFKFMRNGKEIVVDAKKAASILGQGAAISEDARQLKIERAEFDEYLSNKRAETEGLILAMEFTVAPQIQRAYDEIVKTQGYQNIFQQQLAQAYDPATQARIRANMAQNEQYIAQQAQLVNSLKPQVQQFYEHRKKQVEDILTKNRKAFADKELRNEFVYNEVRNKVADGWRDAHKQLVPGIDNIDLISSDEHVMSLLRDGLKYRDRPKAKSAGGSIAALTNRKGSTNIQVKDQADNINNLREKAKSGDKKAADNVLMAHLQNLRAVRSQKTR